MSTSFTEAVRHQPSRIAFLDGLRGVAILLVLLFHAYARWPQIVPFGDRFAGFPLFKYGWLGVELFFMISGFVILMTLEKCASFSEFIGRRWLQLFPAMLLCSLLVFYTESLFPARPAGISSYRDLIPGLTFAESGIWARVLGSPQGVLEGAFWSLFVEVKFYIIFGALYFFLGRKAALIGLGLIFIISSRLFGGIVNVLEYSSAYRDKIYCSSNRWKFFYLVSIWRNAIFMERRSFTKKSYLGAWNFFIMRLME